ncbi:MFS transporter [Kitasatospora phosalacinea]|uniref:MFS transporter n=1 Tax=Kitasatospora phosalacinea TaxID=2065 RepID=UPI0036675D1D
MLPAQLYLAIPLSRSIQQDFAVDAGTASWTGGAFSVAYAVGFLLFGPVSDRVSHRRVLVCAAAAAAVSTALVGASPGIHWLIALRVVQGLAAAAFPPVALAYAAEHAPGGRAPRALAAITTGLLGSSVAGQVFGQLVADHGSWRTAFVLPAVLYAAAALALHRCLAPGRPPRAASWWRPYAMIGPLLRGRGTVAVFATAVTVFGSLVAVYGALDVHLRDERHLSGGVLVLVPLIGTAGLAAGPVAGAGRHGPRTRAACGFLLAAAGLPLVAAPQVAVVLAGSVVFMAGISLVVPALIGLLHRMAPTSRGAAVAVHSFVLFLGASLGQLTASALSFPLVIALSAAQLVLAAAVVALFTGPGP